MADADHHGSGARTVRVTDFKELRRQAGLAPTQLAEALDVSTATIEAWERGLNSPPDIEVAARMVEAFAGSDATGQQGKNLIFNHYPLRVARDLLSLSVEQMAEEFGPYSRSSWTKIEASFRSLPDETLRRIEDRVRAKLAEIGAIK
jgi:DNA-binding XRE family transcriptional regulator